MDFFKEKRDEQIRWNKYIHKKIVCYAVRCSQPTTITEKYYEQALLIYFSSYAFKQVHGKIYTLEKV